MAEVLAELVVDIKGRVEGLEKSMVRAETRAQTATQKIAGMFKRMGTTLSATFGGLALFNELRKGAKAFIELDKGMRKVNTVAGVTEAQIQSLRGEVLTLSDNLGTPTSDLTGAMYQAVSAGVKVGNVMEFMEVATKGAIAGITTTETAVDGLTTVLNAFGLKASQVTEVSDAMFTTIRLGKTTAEELAASYNTVASIAAVAGIKFDELSAAVATLTVQGVPTSIAMNQLRAVIIAMTKELGDGWRETMTFQEGLEEMTNRADGSQNALKEMIGRVEGVNAVLGLTGNNAETFSKALQEMTTKAGATQKAFEEMEKSMSRKIEKLGTQVENTMVRAFDLVAPSIEAWLVAFDEIGTHKGLGKVGDDAERTGIKIKDAAKAVEWFIENILTFAPKTIFTAVEIYIKTLVDTAQWGVTQIKKLLNIPLDFKFTGVQDSGRFGQDIDKMIRDRQLGRNQPLVDDLKEELSEVQKIQVQIEEKTKLYEEGNHSLERHLELYSEIEALNAKLTGEMDKQVLSAEQLVRSSREYLETLKLIQDNVISKGVAGFDEKTTSELALAPDLKDLGGQMELQPDFDEEHAKFIAEYFKDIEASTENVDQKFISILNATASISSILNIGAHTFIGVLLSGLSKANSIANSIFGLISAFAGGGGGGILGFLFGGAGKALAQGGSVLNGKQIASYAGGVSGVVPAGFPNDSFPMMVQSGEQVDITPTHKVGDTAKSIGKMGAAINNLIETVVSKAGADDGSPVVNVYLEGEFIAGVNEKKRNSMRRSGVNLEQL